MIIITLSIGNIGEGASIVGLQSYEYLPPQAGRQVYFSMGLYKPGPWHADSIVGGVYTTKYPTVKNSRNTL